MNTAHIEMVESVRAAFGRAFGDHGDVIVVMAPGRVNLIGEYTDVNDGFVFPMTVDRGVYFAIRARTDATVRVSSLHFDELVEYELDAFEVPEPGTWRSYVLGVVEELRLRGLLEHGFEAVVDGNLKLGAGLSSSAALEICTAIALQEVSGFDMDRVDMVKLCQHVEHKYANVLCGIMDQFACGVGRSGHALLLDCRSLDYQNIRVELGDHRVVIISSEVKRSLASSAYNLRRAECQAGVEHFAQHNTTIRSLRDVSEDLFEAHSHELKPVVFRRCRHVLTENRRTLDASSALGVGALDVFGELMTASHQSLRDDFEVSCAELDLLVELAIGTEGVLGSRMTGAGFGGCTVNIVHKDTVETLLETVNVEYQSRFDRVPAAFVLNANLEAGRLS